MNKIYIYLKEDSELGEAIEQIRKTKEKEIILVVPQKAKAFLHPVNLEIFKKEIENLGKIVYLSTDDEKIINLARNYQLPLFLEDREEKQIIDVKPPKKKVEGKVQAPGVKIKINFKKIFFYLFISIFSALAFIFLLQIFQTKAQIVIETKKSEIDINEVITLDKNILTPDYQNKKLPAEEVSFEINLTVSTSTTGKVFSEERPLLKVTFLNYLEREIPLVAGTRLAYRENIFRTTERIVIPPKNNNGPGKISTQAFPDEIKDENLVLNQNADLKIVALENKKTETGMLWSDVLKAKVEEDYRLETQKIGSVTPEDITNIKLLLERSLKENIQTGLALKYPQSFYIFDPTLVEVKIINISPKNVGEKANKISAMGEAKINTLITSQKDFDDFIKYLINQQILDQGKNLSLKELKDKEITLFDFDKFKKIATLGFKAKAVLVPDLNIEKIKADLLGKSIDEVQNYFSNFPGIEKISIKIFPQWKNSLPQDPNKIQVIVK